jgi:hypothetical protein
MSSGWIGRADDTVLQIFDANASLGDQRLELR